MTVAEKGGHGQFLELAREEVALEERRRASLEQRGLSLVTIAGTLVTLVGIVSAISGSKGEYIAVGVERMTLIVALLGFIGAVAMGMSVNLPHRVTLIDPDSLLEVARNLWRGPDHHVDARILATQVENLRNFQKINDLKALLLLVGLGSLTLAIASFSCWIALRL